jgi:hypothetical protein
MGSRGRGVRAWRAWLRLSRWHGLDWRRAPVESRRFVLAVLSRQRRHIASISWRAALKHWQNEGFIPHPREIKQMIKIADALGLSDDVVLLPHLKSLASAEKRSPNVLPIKLPGKK